MYNRSVAVFFLVFGFLIFPACFGSVSVISSDASSNNQLVLGSAVDTDKYHDISGSWSTNWYNDLNGNGSHDSGEPFGDTAYDGWTAGTDNSCWLASACNMLEQAGAITSAADLYADYALNGIPDGYGNILTFDDGGLQGYAINYWLSQNPAETGNLQLEVRAADSLTGSSLIFTNGLYVWDSYNPQSAVDNYLSDGWQVGIGMWPLYAFYDSEGHLDFEHYGGHALTIQAIAEETFDCTDSDRDNDYINGTGISDLNTYAQSLMTYGQYYGWYNDFYDGDISTYPVGDFGYICAIKYIPEPATIIIFVFGTSLLARFSKRR